MNRLAQGVGKQYAYDTKLSEVEELKKKVMYYKIKVEVMGKYWERSGTALFLELVDLFKATYSFTIICKCMGISRPTYYRWRQKKFSKMELEKQILAICEQLKFWVGHRMVKGVIEKCRYPYRSENGAAHHAEIQKPVPSKTKVEQEVGR